MWTREAVIAVVLWVQVATVTPQLSCIAQRESNFDAYAIGALGEVGVVQWLPSTHEWLAGLFRERADLGHSVWGLLAGGATLGNPVHDMLLAAWAMSEGYGRHWSTWRGCNGKARD